MQLLPVAHSLNLISTSWLSSFDSCCVFTSWLSSIDSCCEVNTVMCAAHDPAMRLRRRNRHEARAPPHTASRLCLHLRLQQAGRGLVRLCAARRQRVCCHNGAQLCCYPDSGAA